MAAATIEELGDDLDASLQWRRMELHAIRTDIESLTPQNEGLPRGRAILRGGVALLYAHWEGFTKEACQSYLDFVARRRLKVGELSDAFVMLALRRIANRMATGDVGGTAAMVDAARRGSDFRPQVPRQDVVATQGNLRFRTLSDILLSLGMPVDAFETKAQLIDRTLCDGRNDIAHGRAAFPRRDEFLPLHIEVLGMMEQVRDVILQHAGQGLYRAPA